MPVDEERVKWLVENHKKLEEERWNFAVKHGFAYKRPQDFKNCIVIRWKWVFKHKINYPLLEEYTKISHDLSDKYNLWDEKNILLETELRLIKAGIYCFTEFSNTVWAIPNEFKEVQDYVLSKIPNLGRG